MKILKYYILLLLCFSCTAHKKTPDFGTSLMHYATLLDIYNIEDSVMLCKMKNPWNDNKPMAQYLIVPKTLKDVDTKAIEEEYGTLTVLYTPLSNITLTNACHGYLMNQLGAMNNVGVYCDSEYILNKDVKRHLSSGKIANAGSSMNPTFEIIISKGSDAFFVSPFENTSESFIATLPIPVIYCTDYMETDPLARAEWMKFYGLLVGKNEEADSLFNIIEKNYKTLSDSIKNINEQKRTILAEIPYQSTWYVPAGNSTMGILYKDAGFVYPWAEEMQSGSLALSPEEVLSKAQDADIWIFKYYSDHKMTKEEFISKDKFFGQFKAAKEGEIYGCNTSSCDFYDVTPFRPDILLDEMLNLGKYYFEKIE